MPVGQLIVGTMQPAPTADYCPCLCSLPTLTLMVATRSADAPPAGNADHYGFATANIGGKPYSPFAPGSSYTYAGGSTIASLQTQYNTNQSTPPDAQGAYTVTVDYYTNTTTGPQLTQEPPGYTPPPPFQPEDTLTVTLQDGQYQWRLDWACPFDSVMFRVKWRVRTANYTGVAETVTDIFETPQGDPGSTQHPTTYRETGAVSYTDQETIVTFRKGDTTQMTDVYTVSGSSLSAGDTVTIIGPSAIGQYASQMVFRLDTHFAQAEAWKNGFPPYTIDASAGNGYVPAYTTETATATDQAKIQYGGSQSVLPNYQIVPDYYYFDGMVNNGFTPASTPDLLPGAGCISSTGLGDFSGIDVSQASQLAPTTIQYPDGLILSLSGEISTGALQSAVDAKVANVDLSSQDGAYSDDAQEIYDKNGSSRILAYRYLPASQLYYVAKKTRFRIDMEFEVDVGVLSRDPTATGAKAYLCPPSGNVTGTIPRITTNLDSGASSTDAIPAEFEFDVASDTADPGDDNGFTGAFYIYYDDWQDADTPGSNLKVTVGTPVITTDTLDCWLSSPVVEYVDPGDDGSAGG